MNVDENVVLVRTSISVNTSVLIVALNHGPSDKYVRLDKWSSNNQKVIKHEEKTPQSLASVINQKEACRHESRCTESIHDFRYHVLP